LRRDLAQREELARLRQRVHTLEAAGPGGASAQKSGESPFYAPTKDELSQMAKECKLKWDAPRIDLQPEQVGPKHAAELGLTDGGRAASTQVMSDTPTGVVADPRQLYVDVTGDKAGAAPPPPEALENEILAKSPGDSVREAYRRIAAERAGQASAPADVRG